MNKKIVLKRSVIAVALTLASSQVVLAQETQSGKAIEKVVVTGSNIKRATVETASPVQVITRKEIQQTGASNVRELLDTVTATSTNALNDKEGSNSFASGASGVDLRDMGKASTLILVNSRRVANYGFADGAQVNFANIDTIPADIIDRIEILKDGASAIYGSDAVAGVINIITRKEYNGINLRATTQHSLLNSHLSRNQTASITFGVGDLGAKGYNLVGHVELYHRNSFTTRDIINSTEPWVREYTNPNFGVRSTFSYPGNFAGAYPDDYADPNLAGSIISQPVKGCLPQNLQGGLCRFDQWARLEATPSADRVNTFFSGRKTLSENLTLFSELQLSKTKTVYNSTPPLKQPGDSSTWYDAKNKKVLFFSEPDLPVGHPDNPFSFDIPLRYRYADNVDMFKSTTESTQHRVLAGLEGSHWGWDWNAAIGNMASDVTATQRGPKDFKAYVAAVTSGEYRFGGNNSVALLDRMFPVITSKGKSTETFFDIRASREIMPLPGGKMAMAAGLELRHETFSMIDSANIRNAEIIGRGATDISGSRNLSAAFVELVAPVTKQFEANFALRTDKNSGVKPSLVPKLGLRFNATDFLTFRGTYAHGFRSPNLAESGGGSLSAFQNDLDDPKRCKTANAIYRTFTNEEYLITEDDRINALSVRDSGCAASASVLVTPNPDLEVEKSKSYTFGFILEPVKDVSILVDYFHIDRRNEIGTKDVNQVLANEDRVPGSVGRLPVSARDRAWAARAKELSGQDINFTSGELSGIVLPYENLAKSRRAGIDVEISSRWKLGSIGRLRAGLEATYMIDYRSWDSVTKDLTENLVGNYDHSRVRAVAKFSLESGNWTWGSRINYRSGTRLISDRYDENNSAVGCEDRGILPVDCRVAADTTVDLSMEYTGIKNASLLVNLGNVFNRPALIDVRGSTLPRGRTAKVTLEYKF